MQQLAVEKCCIKFSATWYGFLEVWAAEAMLYFVGL